MTLQVGPDYTCPHCGSWHLPPPKVSVCRACGQPSCPTCMFIDCCVACSERKAQQIASVAYGLAQLAQPQEQQMSERTSTAQECAELVDQQLREADLALDVATRYCCVAIAKYRAIGQAIRDKYTLPEGPK